MMQNSVFNGGNESSGPKLTVSTDQFSRSNDSRILSAQDCDAVAAIKKVTSLRCNDVKTKNKNKNDHSQKAINAKLNLYKSAQNKFQLECNSLIQSYETIKKLQSEDDGLKLENLETTVKDIVGKQFGIKFPKPNAVASKKDHPIFVPNPKRSTTLDINYSTGHENLDLAIIGLFEDAWKHCLDISEINAKYDFWLKLIMEPNRFCDLYDVREYLMTNMLNEEQTIGAKLNTIYNHLELKIINVINEFSESLMSEKVTKEQNSVSIEKPLNEGDTEEFDTHAEVNLETAIEDYKHKMDAKLKLLETENQKLNQKEAEYSKQIKTLTGELSFRNRKLSNIKERVQMLTKEKNDLISTIEKMEVKDGGLQTLQDRYDKMQENNERLRSIIDNEYDRVIM